MSNQWILRLEGTAVFGLSLFANYVNGWSWILFAVLLLAPDIGMIGYAWNRNAGARIYNAFHTYLAPVALGIAGYAMELNLLMQLALIWTAHIGMDRMLGYGLKYEPAFQDTHLQRVA